MGCGWSTFLVLNLALDVVDGVGRLDLQSNGLPGQGLHEDLHYVHAKITRNTGGMINELFCLPQL